MRKTNILFALLGILFLLGSCSSTQGGSTGVYSGTENQVTSSDFQNPTDLTDFLRRVSGVNVVGSGGQAQITVRGPVSFSASNQGPLFVVDGVNSGYDYSRIFNSVNPREVARVKVLKGGNDAAIYGTQGGAGVVEIYTKR